MESLSRKLESSKTWKGIPTVTVVAIKDHLSQTHTETQYWILLTSRRLNDIICFLASHASLLNIRICGLCSPVASMDLTRYVTFRPYFLATAQDFNNMDFLFIFSFAVFFFSLKAL